MLPSLPRTSSPSSDQPSDSEFAATEHASALSRSERILARINSIGTRLQEQPSSRDGDNGAPLVSTSELSVDSQSAESEESNPTTPESEEINPNVISLSEAMQLSNWQINSLMMAAGSKNETIRFGEGISSSIEERRSFYSIFISPSTSHLQSTLDFCIDTIPSHGFVQYLLANGDNELVTLVLKKYPHYPEDVPRLRVDNFYNIFAWITPLHAACLVSNVSGVRLLLTQPGVKVNEFDFFHQTPFLLLFNEYSWLIKSYNCNSSPEAKIVIGKLLLEAGVNPLVVNRHNIPSATQVLAKNWFKGESDSKLIITSLIKFIGLPDVPSSIDTPAGWKEWFEEVFPERIMAIAKEVTTPNCSLSDFRAFITFHHQILTLKLPELKGQLEALAKTIQPVLQARQLITHPCHTFPSTKAEFYKTLVENGNIWTALEEFFSNGKALHSIFLFKNITTLQLGAEEVAANTQFVLQQLSNLEADASCQDAAEKTELLNNIHSIRAVVENKQAVCWVNTAHFNDPALTQKLYELIIHYRLEAGGGPLAPFYKYYRQTHEKMDWVELFTYIIHSSYILSYGGPAFSTF